MVNQSRGKILLYGTVSAIEVSVRRNTSAKDSLKAGLKSFMISRQFSFKKMFILEPETKNKQKMLQLSNY